VVLLRRLVVAVLTAISQPRMEPDRLPCQFVESVCRTGQPEFRKLPENTRNWFKHKAMLMYWLEFGPCYLAQPAGVEERLQTWWEGKKEITPPQGRNVSAELVEQVDFKAGKLAPSMVDRAIAFRGPANRMVKTSGAAMSMLPARVAEHKRPTERYQQKAMTDCQARAPRRNCSASLLPCDALKREQGKIYRPSTRGTLVASEGVQGEFLPRRSDE